MERMYYLSENKNEKEILDFFRSTGNGTGICFSIIDKNAEEISVAFERALNSGCDHIEWRADLSEFSCDLEKVKAVAIKMLKRKDIFIVTDFELADFENVCAVEIYSLHGIGADLSSSIENALTQLSSRNFSDINIKILQLDDLSVKVKKIMLMLKNSTQAMVKLGLVVSNDADVSEFIKGVQMAKADMGTMPYIAIGLSESGRKTRRLDCEIGNFMTYASVFGDEPDESFKVGHSKKLGQYSIKELLEQRKLIKSNKKNAIIEVINLVFAYDESDDPHSGAAAIDDISFTVERGSFVAVIGRNGSGKSTLAKNFNALLVPTSGQVIVDGKSTSDPENIWHIRQNAGMVFQNPDNQLVSSIVEDDVAFGPENLGVRREEIGARVDDSLSAVDMLKFKKSASHMLSGGQKQRIAIAGVLAMKPSCIIFDEPTAMLDPKGRSDVMNIIMRLKDEGITVVLITHFMEETMNADKIVVMDKGKIALETTPREIYNDVDLLRSLNFDIPPIVDLKFRLAQQGFEIPDEVLSVSDMVEYLCR